MAQVRCGCSVLLGLGCAGRVAIGEQRRLLRLMAQVGRPGEERLLMRVRMCLGVSWAYVGSSK
jgi:hypothetical protein